MIFFPSLQCILTVYERRCGLPRCPGATTDCCLHCLRSWPQRNSASVLLPCPIPGLCSTESWVLMAVVFWRLCAFGTPETDEQKKKNQTPKSAGSLCEMLRFPSKSEFLLPLALAVDWSWGRSVPDKVQPRNTEEILSAQLPESTADRDTKQTSDCSYLKKREV